MATRSSATLLASILLGLLLNQAPSLACDGSGQEPLPWPVESRIFGSDQEDFWSFGQDVDLDGETAVVGADFADVGSTPDQGAAYVFVLDDGSWTEQERLVAADGASGDRFGRSVGISGDVAVVGADLADIDGEIFQGALYVFERTGDEWTEVQKLTASDGDAQDKLGASAAIQGDLLAVGATFEEGGRTEGCQTGAVYAFERSGSVWLEAEKLFDPEGACGDNFGNAVALDGDTIAVGANAAEIDGGINRGAVYVYVLVGGEWLLEQKLLASDGEGVDEFGASVALDGDTLLVGAHKKTIGGNVRQGAAYVFRRNGGAWTEEQRLTATDGQAEGSFGTGAALLGHVALVGAEFSFPGDPERGVVYEYRYDGSVWNEIQKFAAPVGQGFDSFGRKLALTSRHLLIANKDNIVVSPPGGTAWIFGRPTLFADGFETGDTGRWSQAVP